MFAYILVFAMLTASDMALAAIENTISKTRPWRSYQPHAKQLQFHQSKAHVRSILGGNRSGKTRGGAQEAVWHVTNEHPYLNVYVPEKRPQRGRIVGDAGALEAISGYLHELLPDLMVEVQRKGRTWDYFWRIRRGGKVVAEFDLMTYDQDVKQFASVELDWCWFDEPPPLAIWRETWLRFATSPYPNIWVTMTPLMSAGYYIDEVIDNKDIYSEEFYVAITDNTYLPRSTVDTIIAGIRDPDEYEARVNGRFKALMGRVFKEWDRSIHVIPEDDVDMLLRDRTPAVSCFLDPHDRKQPAVVWFATFPGPVVVAIDCLPIIPWDEVRSYTGGAVGVVKMIEEREKQFGYRTVYNGMDPKFGAQHKLNSDVDVQTLYRRAGRSFTLARVKDLQARHTAIRGLLTPGISGYPGLLVSSRARNVIKSFERYVWKESKNPEDPVSQRVVEVWKDFIDCVGYMAVTQKDYESGYEEMVQAAYEAKMNEYKKNEPDYYEALTGGSGGDRRR